MASTPIPFSLEFYGSFFVKCLLAVNSLNKNEITATDIKIKKYGGKYFSVCLENMSLIILGVA